MIVSHIYPLANETGTHDLLVEFLESECFKQKENISLGWIDSETLFRIAENVHYVNEAESHGLHTWYQELGTGMGCLIRDIVNYGINSSFDLGMYSDAVSEYFSDSGSE